jgi:hypothetical protein
LAASTITRDTWTNDSGSAASPAGDGTTINNAALQNNVYARIDAMFSGAGAYATLTFGGLIAAEGFGLHTFSAGGTGEQSIRVRNTTAGTTNKTSVVLGNNSTATLAYIQVFSSTYTTSGPSIASGALFGCEGAGGMALVANHVSGVIGFYTGGTTLRGTIDASGLFSWVTPGIHNFAASTPVSLYVNCSAAGAGNYGSVGAENNASEILQLRAHSTTFSTLNYAVQGAGLIDCSLANGLHSAAYVQHAWWERAGSTQMAALTSTLTADNGLFLKNGLSLHVGSISRVGRSTTNPTNVINMYPGTVPAGTMAGGLQIYAKDSGGGLIKLYYMDSGGTERLINTTP